jgi:hypothetical protein
MGILSPQKLKILIAQSKSSSCEFKNHGPSSIYINTIKELKNKHNIDNAVFFINPFSNYTFDRLIQAQVGHKKNQLPLAPPVFTGFFMAPEDLVLDFVINFEAPACGRPFAFLETFFASVFLLM